MNNIVDTVVKIGKFKILIQTLRETDLIETLSLDGPYTILAPTDEAFNKLPKQFLEDILKNKEQLTELLTHHIIQKKVMANSFNKISTISTSNGKKLSVDSRDTLQIDDGRIIEKDIICLNGIIHIIDCVLIPK